MILMLFLLNVMSGDVVPEIQTKTNYFEGKGAEDYARGLYALRFTPDGRFLVAGGQINLFSVAHDAATHTLSANQRLTSRWTNSKEMAMSADGNWFFFPTVYADFFRMDPATGTVETATLNVDLSARTLNLIQNDEQLITMSPGIVSVYSVDGVGGVLTEVATYRQEDLGVDGLTHAQDLVVTPNEEFVYVVGDHEGGNIATYYRDTATGQLYFLRNLRADDPTDAVMSRDGTFLYISSWAFDGLDVYEVVGSNGELSLIQSIRNGVNGVNGLNGVLDLVLSPDESTLVTASDIENALAVFQRNEVTGLLTFVEIVTDPVGSVDFSVLDIDFSPVGNTLVAAAVNTLYAFTLEAGRLTYTGSYSGSYDGLTGFQDVTSVAGSADGRFVYLADPVGARVTAYPNLEGDGGLGMDAVTWDAATLPGLTNAQYIGISEDGAYAYHLSTADNTLLVTSRDPATGALSFLQQISGLPEMDGPTEVVESSDGQNVYVPAQHSDSLLVFTRDPATGLLTHSQTLTDGGGVEGLDGAVGVAVSPDGRHVYSVGRDAGALTTYRRDPLDGSLTYVAVSYGVEPPVGPPYGLMEVADVAVHPSGRFVYTAGFAEGGILIFDRDETLGTLAVAGDFLVPEPREMVWVGSDHLVIAGHEVHYHCVDGTTGAISVDEEVHLEPTLDVAVAGNHIYTLEEESWSSILSQSLVQPYTPPANQFLMWFDQRNVDGTSRKGLFRMNLATTEVTPVFLDDDLFDDPVKMALDRQTGTLYWTERLDGQIRAMLVDGSPASVVLGGLTNPIGIAVDEGARHLYFAEYGAISRCDLDGSNREILLSAGSDEQFEDLAIDPSRGYMFWSDSRLRRIARANMDGTGKQHLRSLFVHTPLVEALPASGELLIGDENVFNGVKRLSMEGGPYEDVLRTASLPQMLAYDPVTQVAWTMHAQGDVIEVGKIVPGFPQQVAGATEGGFASIYREDFILYTEAQPVVVTAPFLSWHSDETSCLGNNLNILDLVAFVNNQYLCP